MKNRKLTIPAALMLMLLAVVCTFNITFFVATDYYNTRLEELEEMETRYSKLKTVADIVEKYFVADYQEADAIEGALAGYVDGLGDTWSAYYTAQETAAIEEDEANSYVGIGVTYSVEEATKYQITGVTAGGPADLAGILPGDFLVSADGTQVSSLESTDDLAAIVKGEVGTTVTIVVKRGEEELTFNITRDTVRTYSVTSKLLENNVGYIAIADFDNGVDEEVAAHLQSLQAQGAKGFVFDVRNNPGGYLKMMCNILDTLLPEGIIITTVDKAGSQTPYTSDADRLEAPLAVITNEYSISAAEFFAAALQEYDAATIVGQKTSGKGYSQQTFKLGDGSSVHISTTRYYTPKGNSLAETGVTPDRLVEMPVEDTYALASGKLEPADDEQLQAAIQVLTGLIQQLPTEEAPADAETPAA
ncbi:MAG: S41 family peptidase [Clostridia bacterium]|nr:S41 family peptidase [Clostridia bacterium]